MAISGKTHLDEVKREMIYSMKVVRSFNRLLDRHIEESVLIHRSKFDILLSRKEEWHRVQATRVLSQAQVALSLDGHVQVGGGWRGEGRASPSKGRQGNEKTE